VDLSSALGVDGTFKGADGLVGSVDMKQWRVVSDLTAGEPPRFEPATAATFTPNAWNALSNGTPNSFVDAVAVSGSDVYVGGNFYQSAGLPANADFIAKWNGSTWSALPHNTSPGATAINNDVNAIAISGSNVYVGGEFFNAGGSGASTSPYGIPPR
jgi:hypothetical protein